MSVPHRSTTLTDAPISSQPRLTLADTPLLPLPRCPILDLLGEGTSDTTTYRALRDEQLTSSPAGRRYVAL